MGAFTCSLARLDDAKLTWRTRTVRPDVEPVIPYPPPSTSPSFLSLYGPNLYPDKPDGFQAAIKAYRAPCTAIAHKLVTLIGESLSPTPELFTSLFIAKDDQRAPSYSRLKVVQYPPVEPGEQGFGVGAHRDGGGQLLFPPPSSR